MSMDLMPDDCLLNIFNFIHDTRLLHRCLRVCRRWNRLINYRLAKVEKLIDEISIIYTKVDERTLCYYTKPRALVEPILAKILKRSPKLKLVTVGLEYGANSICEPKLWAQKSLNLLSKLESLKWLILSAMVPEEVNVIPQSVEILVSTDTCIKQGFYPRVKQLIVEDDVFIDAIHRFPNLENVNLRIVSDHDEWFETACKNQYLFKNLRTIEIDSTHGDSSLGLENNAVRFIELCPLLESAYLKMSMEQSIPNDKFRHENLVNLEVTYIDLDEIEFYFLNLIYLLKRFPNIKRLTIRYDTASLERAIASYLSLPNKDEHEEPMRFEEDNINRLALPYIIVHILKKLVFLDMRNIVGIDETCAQYVEQYCKKNKRSMKFLFGSTGNYEIRCYGPELNVEQDQLHFTHHFLRFRSIDWLVD